MAMWFVSTLTRYVLVEADDEHEARTRGSEALSDLYADVRKRLDRDVPLEIRTVRLARDDEIRLMGWHDAMVAREMPRDPA